MHSAGYLIYNTEFSGAGGGGESPFAYEKTEVQLT